MEQSKALNRKFHLPNILTSLMSVVLLKNCKLYKNKQMHSLEKILASKLLW